MSSIEFSIPKQNKATEKQVHNHKVRGHSLRRSFSRSDASAASDHFNGDDDSHIDDHSMNPIPQLPPGAHRKRNVFDVLEALPTDKASTLLIRVDFNVPMNHETGEITDDSRIRGALPTIQSVLRSNNNVVLVSHMGRPKLVQKGEDTAEARQQRQDLSLRPVAEHLSTLLGEPVLFGDDCMAAQEVVAQLPKEGGGICLLENLRFYKQEEKNDAKFAETLASYADAYINDAFGTCHRAHASVSGVPQVLGNPKVCGIGCLVASELAFLDFTSVGPDEKIAAVIGGSKVSTKLPVIQGLLKTVDILVLGGGLAFTFLKAQGVPIGDSLLEESMLDTAKELLAQAQETGKTIVLPVDAVCAKAFPKTALDKERDTRTFDLDKTSGIETGWMGLDVGPQTVALYQSSLAGCTKLVLNGPSGVFEVQPFDEGTRGLVQVLADLTKQGTVTVVGGGDSVAALEAFGETKSVSYVSTGGGATLELLAGDVLPGVAAIEDFE